MNLHIRRANPEDAVIAVPLIIDAIGEIASQMTGETDPIAVEQELIGLFKHEDNRHSYLHTFVAEHQNAVIAVMVHYSGVDALTLDNNLITWLSKKGGKPVSIPPEARQNEYYIDTICVHQNYRRQGIGRLFLEFAEEVARDVGYSKIALNVETEKEKAIRLYELVGYQIAEPWEIYGGTFHHMVKEI
ncbi:MAG: GNAT family N-acetyltransferase [Bacillus sp. (in: Bacteria)]|nr:GNAT family N-acetyltransferase [Bacillus sp. (in: firmicutes)]